MDRLRQMETFARVVQAGSFVGAADRLDQAASVVSKHVAKLERELGVKLLNRTTRKVSLTEAGSTYYDYCRRILEEVAQSELALAELQAEPQGHLRLATMNSLCTNVLAPMLPGFLARYPKIQLEVSASDHVVNLVEDGFDLGLRIVPSPSENLVARKLAPVRFSVCGSPDYFARFGRPTVAEDLSAHRCITFPYTKPGFWTLFHKDKRVEVPVISPLTINSFDTVKELVAEGTGLALLPNYVIADDLQRGRIEIALPEYRGIAESDLYAVYLPNRFGSPTIKAFVEYIAEHVQTLNL